MGREVADVGEAVHPERARVQCEAKTRELGLDALEERKILLVDEERARARDLQLQIRFGK